MAVSIGQRIHELRTERSPRLTQRELAERAGISPDVIQKLEQGVKQSARLTTLAKIARALDVDLTTLLGTPDRLETVPTAGGLWDLRRAVDPVDQRPPPADVTARLAQAWRLYWDGDYDRLTAVLPPIIARAGAAQQVEAHALAAALLTQLAHGDLALLALNEADRLVPDELLALEVAWTRTWVLLDQGRFQDSVTVASRMLENARLGDRDGVQWASAWGTLAVTGATAAARAGQPDVTRELLHQAWEAVARAGRDAPAVVPAGRGNWFGPGKIIMMAVDAAVVVGDYPAALAQADRLQPHPDFPLSSWVRHRANMAYAANRLGHRDEAEAILLEVAADAPRWLQYQPFPRAITAELLSGRRVSPQLRTLARQLRVNGTETPGNYT